MAVFSPNNSPRPRPRHSVTEAGRRRKPRAAGTVGEDPPRAISLLLSWSDFECKALSWGLAGHAEREQGISLRPRSHCLLSVCHRLFPREFRSKARDSWIRAGIVRSRVRFKKWRDRVRKGLVKDQCSVAIDRKQTNQKLKNSIRNVIGSRVN